ncbi:hypothetical protein WH47_09772 [Habropoda laboriosa]|uniref:Uncharacterized protein n=1 Tax=Habropoda laboriosa TaxID=597456 RepID=A0A0L7QML5_9HYME|nr:hypothetical protein WH47_09772 [Habropoda laboriosa]
MSGLLGAIFMSFQIDGNGETCDLLGIVGEMERDHLNDEDFEKLELEGFRVFWAHLNDEDLEKLELEGFRVFWDYLNDKNFQKLKLEGFRVMLKLLIYWQNRMILIGGRNRGTQMSGGRRVSTGGRREERWKKKKKKKALGPLVQCQPEAWQTEKDEEGRKRAP